jgi:hypothetical protein
VDDRSFNERVIGSVILAVVIVVLAAYVLAAVVRTGSRDPTQTSIGTIVDQALPLPLLSESFFAPRN